MVQITVDFFKKSAIYRRYRKYISNFLKKSTPTSACLPVSKFFRNIKNFRYFVDISVIFPLSADNRYFGQKNRNFVPWIYIDELEYNELSLSVLKWVRPNEFDLNR